MNSTKRLKYCIICLIIVLTLVLPLSACVKVEKSLEDILPKTFGESEGLFLYSGTVKMRTDGSEKQDIIKSVVINGQTYEQFEIYKSDYAYSPSINKAFFLVQVEDIDYLYLYDYKACDGEAVCSAKRLQFCKSESYVYVKDNTTEKGWLYSRLDGALLCDEIYGELKCDVLCANYSVYDENARAWIGYFTWFYDGKVHTIENERKTFYPKRIHRHENYLYFLENVSEVSAINLVDGTKSYLSDDYNYHDMMLFGTVDLDEGIYAMVRTKSGDDHLYTLYKFSEGKAEIAYSFGKNPDGGDIKMKPANGTIYVEVPSRPSDKRYRYDVQTKKMHKVSSIPKQKPERSEDFTVGEYTFYVNPVVYNEYQFAGLLPFPFPSDQWCYFLCREKDGKTEIMQYSTKTNELFDDIREF